MLAQLFCLTVYNRIEAIEAAAIKAVQQDLVSILPDVLIKALEQKINTGLFNL